MALRMADLKAEWYETPFPRVIMGVSLFVTAAGLAVLFSILYVFGFSRGDLGLALSIAALAALSVTVIWYSALRRSPSKVGFSDLGVHIEFRGGATSLLMWETVHRVEVHHILGEDFADVYNAAGKREDRVHVYGEAAKELRRRFDVLKQQYGR